MVDDLNGIDSFKNLKLRYPFNILISYININSIRNKFCDLKVLISDTPDVMTIAETKLDESFTTSQFLLKGYQIPFRHDCSSHSGGLLTFVRDGIPAKLLDFKFDPSIQIIPIELNIRNKKWLIFNIYRPDRTDVNLFLRNLSDAIHFYEMSYDNIIAIGDFNLEPTDPKITNFLELIDMENVMKAKTCFKTTRGTCIDLILTNSKNSIQSTGIVETGLSDFHLLIYTMLKTKYMKLPAKKVKYRDYKYFNEEFFLYELNHCLTNNTLENYDQFENLFTNILQRHAPLKTKLVRANSKPYVTKNLRKAIMTRSRLKVLANKTKKPEDMVRYKQQRNLVVRLNKQAKKDFFSKTENKPKHFWEAVKPIFSEKDCGTEKRIQLLENNILHVKNENVANIFNSYFNRITEHLDIPNWENQNLNAELNSNSTTNFENHPSINSIKNHLHTREVFEFSHVEEQDVLKVLLGLNTSKSVSGNIPTRMLKSAAHLCVPFLTSCFNSCIDTCTFPDRLKLADIIPSFKRGSTTDKGNYRPISLLPVVSKIFERLLVNQLLTHLDPKFSKLLCGFRQGHSTQHAILNMLRQWQNCIANNGKIGAILIDLSKAFDCLPHDLLLAKLSAYGVGENSVKLIRHYLTNRMHRVRIGSYFSSWLEILLGVPQGSILGPLLFNIFINDLLYDFNDITNFADDNTIFDCKPNLDDIITNLTLKLDSILNWFRFNSMVANPSKFQLIFPGTSNANISIECGNISIKSVEVVKLLGVQIDSKLSFLPHVKELCKKSNQKIRALRRIRPFITKNKAKLLVNSYILSPFQYCPLIWMFCGKEGNRLVQQCHFRALKVLTNVSNRCYEDLLLDCNSVNIHVRNLRYLAIEVYKSLNGLSAPIMQNIFTEKQSNYDLRSGKSLAIPSYAKYNTTFGTNTFDFRAVMTWVNLPAKIKCQESLSLFKLALTRIVPKCGCKNCT